MKYLLFGILIAGMFLACSDTEEGLIGEWEGTTDRVNSKGKPIISSVKCIIGSTDGAARSMLLTVAGIAFEFNAIEDMNEITYRDNPVLNDTTESTFVTGNAVLQNDTLLHFEHMLYKMKNGAVLYQESEDYDLVRK